MNWHGSVILGEAIVIDFDSSQLKLVELKLKIQTNPTPSPVVGPISFGSH